MTPPPQLRPAIEAAIEALIGVLDLLDGDTDQEPEIDTGADDVGERCGDTFMERRA